MFGAKSREEYQKFYNEQGKFYSNQHLSEGWERITPQVKYYKGVIFEAGTQSGGVTKILSKYAQKVVTCDVSKTYLEKAKEYLKDVDNVEFRHGFAEDILGEYLNEFDVVCANEIFEHVIDDRLLFDRAMSALKSDGVLLYSVPLENVFPDTIGEHARFYGISDIINLVYPYKHYMRIEPTECPIWIVGAVWKVESAKKAFMQNIGFPK